jgi:hypothetical protein
MGSVERCPNEAFRQSSYSEADIHQALNPKWSILPQWEDLYGVATIPFMKGISDRSIALMMKFNIWIVHVLEKRMCTL